MPIPIGMSPNGPMAVPNPLPGMGPSQQPDHEDQAMAAATAAVAAAHIGSQQQTGADLPRQTKPCHSSPMQQKGAMAEGEAGHPSIPTMQPAT